MFGFKKKLKEPKEIEEVKFCSDCRFHKKGASAYWDQCTHTKSVWFKKVEYVRKEENRPLLHFCEYMRDYACTDAQLFEPKETNNGNANL